MSLNNDDSGVYVLFLPFFACCNVILLILWMLLIFQLCFNSPSPQQHEMWLTYHFYRYTAICCFTFCVLCSFCDTLHGYLSYQKGYAMLLDHFSWIKSIADLLYFGASASLNIILFGRLYFTFKYSYFALSRFIIVNICVQIIISILLDIAYCVVMIVTESEETADVWSKPMVIIIIFNDFIISTSMLSLFVYKLKELIVNIHVAIDYTQKQQKQQKQKQKQQLIRDNTATHLTDTDVNKSYDYNYKVLADLTVSNSLNMNSVNFIQANANANSNTNVNTKHTQSVPNDLAYIKNVDDDIGDKYESTSILLSELTATADGFDSHQLELIVLITRHTILSGFAIFFNQIFYIITYVSMNPDYEKSFYFGVFTYGLRYIGMIGFVVSLYLSMKFAKPIYFKCCGCCHLNCYRCCLKCTKQSLQQSLSQKR